MRKNRKNNPGLIRLLVLAAISLMVSPLLAQEHPVASAWTSVTVGVADLDAALELWVDVFGFTELNELDGEDEELATLWQILPADIKRQALIGLPGTRFGQLHLVEFIEPGPAVREGAKPYDPSPFGLVVYAEDLPKRVKEMQAAGYTFQTAEPVDLAAADGSLVREIRLRVHDEVTVVLREGPGQAAPFNPRGFSGIAALAKVVDFAPTEGNFYAELMGLELLDEQTHEGLIIEQLMGQLSGSALDIGRWGVAGQPLGQIELIDFRGARGSDLYPVAVPTQLGILHVSYNVSDLAAFKQQLHSAGIHHNERDYRDVIFGSGHFIRFRTPAGMSVEAYAE